MQGQALGEKQVGGQQEVKRIVELNHLNPLVDEINKRVKVDKDDKSAKDTAMVLFELGSVQAGFAIDDTNALADRMGRMLKSGLDVDPAAGPVEEEEYEIEEEEDKKDADEEEPPKDEP